MLAHRHDPFLHRADLVCLAGALERAVIRHDTVLAVKLRALGKQVNIVLFQILIRRLVGDHVNRVRENAPDGKAGELLAALCSAAVPQLHHWVDKYIITDGIYLKRRQGKKQDYSEKTQLQVRE